MGSGEDEEEETDDGRLACCCCDATCGSIVILVMVIRPLGLDRGTNGVGAGVGLDATMINGEDEGICKQTNKQPPPVC